MDIVLVSLAGGILALDTNLVFQFLLSQPLIACTLLGWIAGDIAAGLHFGFLMQMIWLGNMPVGAASVPAGNLASMAGVAVYITLINAFPGQPHLSLLLVILYVIILSNLGAKMGSQIRARSSIFLDYSVKYAAEGYLWSVGRMLFFSLLTNFITFSVFLAIGIFLGKHLLPGIMHLLPDSWDTIARYTEMAIIGVGIGTVLPLYKRKHLQYIMLAGAMLGIIIFLMV